MNNVVLIGRLTRDPELRYVQQSGNAVATFTLAIDRQYSRERKAEMEQKGQPTADFIRITVWGQTAENCANYLAKGRLVAVQGRIQTGSYDDKDGKRVYTTEVVANNVQFLEWGDRGGEQRGQARPQGQNQEHEGYNPDVGIDPPMDDRFESAGSDPFPF